MVRYPALLGVALANGRTKEAFAQSTGTMIPGLGYYQSAAHFRGAEPLGPVLSSTYLQRRSGPRVSGMQGGCEPLSSVG